MVESKLPTTGFLSGASDDLKHMFESLKSEIALDRGEVLFEQGEVGDALCVIVSGALEFSILSEDGRKLSLDMMRAGAIFGEIALFDPGERTATVTAVEPSRVWRVKNADVLSHIRKDPQLAVDMIMLAGQRMRWMNMQLQEQVFLPLPSRLARKILHLAPEQQSGPTSLTLSQTELAEYVGATREAVSKTLAGWKRIGIIDASRGGLVVRDRPALRALAEPGLI